MSVQWEDFIYAEKYFKAKTVIWSLISDLTQEFQWMIPEFNLQPQSELEQIHKKKCQSSAKQLGGREIAK